MKLHPQILILCFYLFCNTLWATSTDQNFDPLLDSKARTILRDVIEYSAIIAWQKYSDASKEATDSEATSKLKKLARYLHRPGPAMLFAAKSTNHARAVLLYRSSSFTYGKGSPSGLQILAGFAQLPCNIKAANKRLQDAYSRQSIPEEYHKSFQEADEYGNWKKLPLPEHLIKPTLKKEKKHCCSIQ